MYHYVSTSLNVSRLVLQLSLPNSLNPGVKWRVKVLLEQRRQAVLQLHLSDQPFYAYQRAPYIKNSMVIYKCGVSIND